MAHPTRIFKKPEELLAKWEEYKEDLKERAAQWEKVQYVGKDGIKVADYPKLPLTLAGFYRYCFQNKVGQIEQYFTNKDDLYSDFVGICRAIKDEIREDQITGGMLGEYNASITQRLQGLVDKKQTELKGEPRIFNVDDDE